LEPFLDRRVEVATKCGKITGVLRAFGQTFLEVQEDDRKDHKEAADSWEHKDHKDRKTELTVVQCEKVCFVRMTG